jgi:O-antigen/teichoic acid export membrane protein
VTEASNSVEVLAPGGWRLSGREAARSPIARGSAWILGSTAIGAMGGGLFWLVAARTSTTTVVGVASALFSSVAFVNYITNLGLPVLVARYGGDRSEAARTFFNWSVVATAVSSVALSVAYLPLVGDRADALRQSGVLVGTGFFAVVTAGTAVGQLVDMRLTVQRRWRWVAARVGLFSVLRFPILLVVSHPSVVVLFAMAAGVPAASGFLAWWLTDPPRGHFRLRPVPETARRAVRYSGINYASHLAVQGPVFVLPVLVLLQVPARDNAAFFIAWSIAITVFLLPINVVKVLLAEGTTEQSLVHQTLIALAVNGVISLVSGGALVAGAGLVTTIYGRNYGDAVDLLPLLALAVIPWTVTMVALTYARVVDDEPATLGMSALFALTVLVPAAVLIDRSGTIGAAQAWMIGNCATAAAAGSWLVVRMRRDSSGSGGGHSLAGARPAFGADEGRDRDEQ